jgi:hypothetical protein
MGTAAEVITGPVPSCLEWDAQHFSNVAVVTGWLGRPQANSLLERLGSVSKFAGMTYWSVTDHRLEVLITESFAVPLAPGASHRPDYSIQEMLAGGELRFSEHDNRLRDPVIYRLRILERDDAHFVVDIANVTPIKRLLMTVLSPGDLRTVIFMARAPDGNWRCYALSGMHASGLASIVENPKSHLNRLLALYGYISQLDPETLPWAK